MAFRSIEQAANVARAIELRRKKARRLERNAKPNTDPKESVADFIARGGAVTKVDGGTALGISKEYEGHKTLKNRGRRGRMG